jgi:hypothetical protein
MYQLSIKPYYDSVCQGYKQIITIYPKPPGILMTIIKQMTPSKLSPFRTFSQCDRTPSCFYAILNPLNKYDLLDIEELPLLLCFLTENGYTINNNITKIMMKSNTPIHETLLFYIN